MALILVSREVVPITLSLAKRFRDMEALKNERALKAPRAKRQAHLLEDGDFFTALWGECLYQGNTLRGNGNHTSNLITACFQAHSKKGLDERAQAFVDEYLFTRGGEWGGNRVSDLPEIEEGKLFALVEKFTAEDEDDLLKFFRRYDPKESQRGLDDLLNIAIGRYPHLDELEKKKVGYALKGVIRAARLEWEKFGLGEDKTVAMGRLRICRGAEEGEALKFGPVREAVQWIVQTVPEVSMYKKVPAAQIMAEIWAKYGPEEGERVVAEIHRQMDEEDTPAYKWSVALNKTSKTETTDALVNKGRKALKAVLDSLSASV